MILAVGIANKIIRMLPCGKVSIGAVAINTSTVIKVFRCTAVLYKDRTKPHQISMYVATSYLWCLQRILFLLSVWFLEKGSGMDSLFPRLSVHGIAWKSFICNLKYLNLFIIIRKSQVYPTLWNVT